MGALADLTGTRIAFPTSTAASPLTAPTCCAAEFGTVDVEVFERETLVPEVEPVVAFLDSMRGLSADLLPSEVEWEAFLGAVRERVADEIAAARRLADEQPGRRLHLPLSTRSGADRAAVPPLRR